KFDGIHVFSDDPFTDIKKISRELRLGQKAIGWWQQNGNFFSALALEKRALFIVLMLIILVASLNIVSSLLMTVMNRRQEIALLLSLGASKAEIKKSFFALGATIGGGGIVFGLVLGLFGVWLLGSFDIVNLPADVYGSAKLPMELSLLD
ncbi:ABC transporter permease, partial [Campylobacter concisus]|uniref:ABC transporter permease n=1 Tax=Campylobacter concisus TaxID=199 RepID=UPI00112FCF23